MFYANPQFLPNLPKFLYRASFWGPSKTLFIEIPKNDFFAYFWGLNVKKVFEIFAIFFKFAQNL